MALIHYSSFGYGPSSRPLVNNQTELDTYTNVINLEPVYDVGGFLPNLSNIPFIYYAESEIGPNNNPCCYAVRNSFYFNFLDNGNPIEYDEIFYKYTFYVTSTATSNSMGKDIIIPYGLSSGILGQQSVNDFFIWVSLHEVGLPSTDGSQTNPNFIDAPYYIHYEIAINYQGPNNVTPIKQYLLDPNTGYRYYANQGGRFINFAWMHDIRIGVKLNDLGQSNGKIVTKIFNERYDEGEFNVLDFEGEAVLDNLVIRNTNKKIKHLYYAHFPAGLDQSYEVDGSRYFNNLDIPIYDTASDVGLESYFDEYENNSLNALCSIDTDFDKNILYLTGSINATGNGTGTYNQLSLTGDASTFKTTVEEIEIPYTNYILTQVLDTSIVLTPQVLANYDAIILASQNRAFTLSEINAIDDFVRQGGGLISLADSSLGGDYSQSSNDQAVQKARNALMRRFGIEYLMPQDVGNDLTIESNLDNIVAGTTITSNSDVTTPLSLAGSSVAGYGNPRPLDLVDKTDIINKSNSIYGNTYAKVAVSEPGLGRVFATSLSSCFNNTNITSPFVVQMIEWAFRQGSFIPGNNIFVEWSDANVSALDEFDVQYSTDEVTWTTFSTIVVGAENYFSEVITGLNQANQYYIRVLYNDIPSEVITVCPGADFAPANPTVFNVTCTSSSTISLVFSYTEIAPTLLRIYRSTDNTNFTLIDTLTSSSVAYTDNGLTPSTTYYYRLYAYNPDSDLESLGFVTDNCTTPAEGALPVGCVVEYTINDGDTWVEQQPGDNQVIIDPLLIKQGAFRFRVNCGGNCIETGYGTPTFPNPIAIKDTVTVMENSSVTIDVLANDSSACGTSSIVITNNPANGTATVINKKIKFTPNPGYVGNATVTYYITDCIGNTSNVATVNIIVNPDISNIAILNINTDDVDNIIIDVQGSTTNGVTQTTGTDTFVLTMNTVTETIVLERGLPYPDAEVTKFSNLGLILNSTGTYNGIISVTKNLTANVSLAYPITGTYQFNNSPTVNFNIPTYGIIASESESASTNELLQASTVPTWPVGGISYISASMPELYNSGRYRTNPIVTGNWSVIETLRPCGTLDTTEYPLNVTASIPLRGAINQHLEFMLSTTVRFRNDSRFTDGVTHNVSLYAVDDYSVVCPDSFIKIRNNATGNWFKVQLTYNIKR